MKRFNYKGELLIAANPILQDSSFGYFDEYGVLQVNWGVEDDISDSNGFDKRYRPIPGTDAYIIEDFIIPAGTELCRYGSQRGRFTTLKGTDYNKLGLPYVRETMEYHEYIVLRDTLVVCRVSKGVVAPKFYSPGGAVQFQHKKRIFEECNNGILKEVRLWE